MNQEKAPPWVYLRGSLMRVKVAAISHFLVLYLHYVLCHGNVVLTEMQKMQKVTFTDVQKNILSLKSAKSFCWSLLERWWKDWKSYRKGHAMAYSRGNCYVSKKFFLCEHACSCLSREKREWCVSLAPHQRWWHRDSETLISVPKILMQAAWKGF